MNWRVESGLKCPPIVLQGTLRSGTNVTDKTYSVNYVLFGDHVRARRRDARIVVNAESVAQRLGVDIAGLRVVAEVGRRREKQEEREDVEDEHKLARIRAINRSLDAAHDAFQWYKYTCQLPHKLLQLCDVTGLHSICLRQRIYNLESDNRPAFQCAETLE